MQFTTLSVALFAAFASAHLNHGAQHFHHRRNINTTATDSGPSTTLTIFQTSVHTITSCAASITDCPARHPESTNEIVVTDTIAVFTTVCPVTEAESASSAALASLSATQAATTAAGAVSTPPPSITAPLGTGVTAAPTAGAGSAGGAEGSGSSETVLTYTLGSGTSTTVVTTTIKHTSTAIVYATLPAESEAAGVVTGKEGVVAASETGVTTTITGTSTSTHYVTVVQASSGAAGGSGAGNCAPVTVTATIALSTVTVTETATPTTCPSGSGSGTGSGSGSGSDSGSGSSGVVTSLGGNKAVVSSSGGPVVILSTATVVPLPVSTGAHYGNGTEAGATSKTKTKCSSVFPSGFISKTKTAEPTGY